MPQWRLGAKIDGLEAGCRRHVKLIELILRVEAHELAESVHCLQAFGQNALYRKLEGLHHWE